MFAMFCEIHAEEEELSDILEIRKGLSAQVSTKGGDRLTERFDLEGILWRHTT